MMASADQLINAFTTLLVTIDPPGLAPIFLGLTVGMSRAQRKQVALRGTIIAFIILAVFALFGSSVLGVLGISIGAFRIAGGLLLFWIGLQPLKWCSRSARIARRRPARPRSPSTTSRTSPSSRWPSH